MQLQYWYPETSGIFTVGLTCMAKNNTCVSTCYVADIMLPSSIISLPFSTAIRLG